jgi:hypothetical protein
VAQATVTVESFLKTVEPYCRSKPTLTKNGYVTVVLKDGVVDDFDKYFDLTKAAKALNATITYTPPGFILPPETKKDDTGTLLFLHESDIEDGGPQPRAVINPSDPDTQSLFESIKPKDTGCKTNVLGVNQRDPIDTYPSPLGNGKYRICEGHRRRMVILNMLRLDGIWALNRKRSEQEAYEDAIILNAKKNLTAYEIAAFILKLKAKFPQIYTTQEVIGKKLGIGQEQISRIMNAFEA